MPFTGNGTFAPPSAPIFPAVPGTIIYSDYFNQIMRDVFAGLSMTLTRDTQGRPNQHFNFNNFKGISLARGTENNDAVRVIEVQSNFYRLLTNTTSSAAPYPQNDYTATSTPASAPIPGSVFDLPVHATLTNTGPMTLNVNGVTWPLVDCMGGEMEPGIIQPGIIGQVRLWQNKYWLIDPIHTAAAQWMVASIQGFATSQTPRNYLPCRMLTTDTWDFATADFPKLAKALGQDGNTRFVTPLIQAGGTLVNGTESDVRVWIDGNPNSHSHDISGGEHQHGLLVNSGANFHPQVGSTSSTVQRLVTGAGSGSRAGKGYWYVRPSLASNPDIASSFSFNDTQNAGYVSRVNDGAHSHTISGPGDTLNRAAGLSTCFFISCDWKI